MDLNKLLEYQESDIRLRRILDIIEKSDDYRKMEQAKNEFANAKKTVEESERAAASMVQFFNAGKNYYDEFTKKLEELERAAEKGTADPETLNQQLGKLKAKITELESRMADRRGKAETVVRAYLDANERGRKLREIHAKSKERQDELFKSREPEISELKKNMSAAEPYIDKEIMKQYKSITAEGKYPAFVEAYVDGKTYSCRGCGMALSQQNSSNLSSNNYCICESCRRIIYKK